jgi:cytidylate kinase
MSSRRPFIVAIDGPAGAGKSTASRLLAARLGFALVDTGAIYRFAPPPAGGTGQRVLLSGEDVSAEIRTPAMSAGASKVSARPVVRAGLLEVQRRLALAPENRGAVLEGRDIGTVVFPDADAKFFVTASPEERARRRYAELLAKGDASSFDQVLADQFARDKADSEREIAPLRPASDALVIDTSGTPIDAVVDRLVREVEGRAARPRG